MPLTPNNREEHWLQGMVDGQTTLEPNNRREHWYKEIIDNGSGGGGGGGVLVVTMDLGTGALDKTWNEINNADYCVAMNTSDGKSFMPIYEIYEDGDAYFVSFTPLGATTVTFEASSADGYPVMSQ